METITDALGQPATVTEEDGVTVLCYTLEQFKQYIDASGVVAVRKPSTYVQQKQQSGTGTLPTLEGPVEISGGLLCCSYLPEAPNTIVDPFVQTRGEAGLRPEAGLYEPLENVPHVMVPLEIRGAEGVTPEVADALLGQFYVRITPTSRECTAADWTAACGPALQVRIDYSWRPTAKEPSVVMRVPDTDDIYFVTRERYEADGWGPCASRPGPPGNKNL